MTTPRDPDELLSAYLADGMEVLPDRVVHSVLDEIHRTRQRPVFGPWRSRPVFRTQLGAAAAVAVLVLGVAFYAIQRGQPAIVGPGATPTVRPSESDAAGPTVRPSASTAPLIWSPASLEEDWPAPVRLEPAEGGAIVTSLAIDRNGPPITYPDPAGDVNASVPWIDIRELLISGSRTTLFIVLEANVTPVVDPTEQWIAYGVVWDTDRDGVADLRFGGDNLGGTHGLPRVWITELHSGRTVVNPGGGYFDEAFYDKFFDVFLPSENWGGARLNFGGDTTGTGPNGGGIVGGMHSPFYAWASVIQDGRVVATDYAPDEGWLDPSAKGKP